MNPSFDRWNASDDTKATNRFDRFTRFKELIVHSDPNQDRLSLSAWYETGSRTLELSLSRADAERLCAALNRALTQP